MISNEILDIFNKDNFLQILPFTQTQALIISDDII